MKLLMAGAVGVAVLVVAAGTFALTTAVDGQSPAGAATLSQGTGKGGPQAQTYDLLPGLVSGQLRVFAVQALEDARVQLDVEADLSGPSTASHCGLHIGLRDAPVEDLMAWADGRPGSSQPPTFEEGSAGWGGGGGHGPLLLTAMGQSLPLGSGSFGSGAQLQVQGDLKAGQWVLYQGGWAGVDAQTLDSDSSWTLDISSSAPVRILELPPAPLACGFLDDLPDITLAYEAPGVGYHQEGGALAFDGVYGSFAHAHFMPRGPGDGQASMAIDGQETSLDDMGERWSATRYGPSRVGLEVEKWQDGHGPFWLLAGVWFPFAQNES